MMRDAYDRAGIPEPGAGAGRPCYIAHDTAWPERECEGLHGAAAAAFCEAEAIVALGVIRDELTTEQEQPMSEKREHDGRSKMFGRAAGYLIGGILVLALVAVVAAGAWWAVTRVWGAVL